MYDKFQRLMAAQVSLPPKLPGAGPEYGNTYLHVYILAKQLNSAYIFT